jgi:hypothetical protein
MSQNAKELRSEIAKLEEQLVSKKSQLRQAETNCRHNVDLNIWVVTPDDVYEPGYTIPGDAPGTMGVDRQFDCYVPSKTTKRWKRVCSHCGKVEHTNRTTERVEQKPLFG